MGHCSAGLVRGLWNRGTWTAFWKPEPKHCLSLQKQMLFFGSVARLETSRQLLHCVSLGSVLIFEYFLKFLIFTPFLAPLFSLLHSLAICSWAVTSAWEETQVPCWLHMKGCSDKPALFTLSDISGWRYKCCFAHAALPSNYQGYSQSLWLN